MTGYPADFILMSAFPDDDAHVAEVQKRARELGLTREQAKIVRHKGGVHLVTLKCVFLD